MKTAQKKLILSAGAVAMLAVGSATVLAREPQADRMQEIEEEKPAETIPVYSIIGKGCKIEAEKMFFSGCHVLEDPSASGNRSIQFAEKESTASFTVKFPAGTYEGLAKEKAKDNAHSTVNIRAQSSGGTENYKFYPSNPPLGIWELTTRSPIYFELEEENEITFTLNAGDSFGMELDYIQFVKIK